MARQHQRPSEKPPSHRQLRAGELIRHAFASVALTLFFVPPAHAEVCDKVVGESWRSADGPVWLLNPVGWPLALLVSGLLLVSIFKLKWLGYVAAALLLLYVLVFFCVDWFPDHQVYRYAIKEGCRSYHTDLMDAALMFCFALAYAWLGYRAKPLGLPLNGQGAKPI
jgi:hypothetical protein